MTKTALAEVNEQMGAIGCLGRLIGNTLFAIHKQTDRVLMD